MATTTPLPPQRKTQKFRDGTCFGVIEEAADTARKNRMERTKPQPWIVRKLMVGFTLGLMGYAAFVYIQYLCLPMIQRKNNSQGSRGIGSALIIQRLIVVKANELRSLVARGILCAIPLDGMGIPEGALFPIDRKTLPKFS
jgi:hypothetical protein